MTATTGARIGTRPSAASDEPLLRRLAAESRPALETLPSPVREQLLDLQWQARARQYGIDHPDARWTVVECDGAAVGHLVVDDTRAAVRVVDIAIAADHRGRGIGRSVLTELVHQAAATGRCVELTVWSDNLAARRLYESLGFDYLTSDRVGHLPMRRSPDNRNEVRGG